MKEFAVRKRFLHRFGVFPFFGHQSSLSIVIDRVIFTRPLPLRTGLVAFTSVYVRDELWKRPNQKKSAWVRDASANSIEGNIRMQAEFSERFTFVGSVQNKRITAAAAVISDNYLCSRQKHCAKETRPPKEAHSPPRSAYHLRPPVRRLSATEFCRQEEVRYQ